MLDQNSGHMLDPARPSEGRRGSEDLLALDSAVTDCNAAFFDAANNFRGVIAGCQEVLRRQGLLEGAGVSPPTRI